MVGSIVLGGWIGGLGLALAAGPAQPKVTVLLPETRGHWVGGVTADRVGNVFVADFQETVWKVTPKGEVEVFATGFYGASGNAIDRRGNLLQSNFYASTISRVDRAGEVETLISDGLSGPVGIALKAGEDDLYVANCSANNILRVTLDGDVSVYADGDLFQCPNGLTFASDGNLYVVNFSNNKMVKITGQGQAEVFVELTEKGLGHLSFLRGTFYVTAFHSHEVYAVPLEGEPRLLFGTGEPSVAKGKGGTVPVAWPNGIVALGWNGQLNLVINESLNPNLTDFPRRTVIRKFVFEN